MFRVNHTFDGKIKSPSKQLETLFKSVVVQIKVVTVAAVDDRRNWSIFCLAQLDFLVGAGCHASYIDSVSQCSLSVIFLCSLLKRCVLFFFLLLLLLFLGGCINPVGYALLTI